MSDRPRPWQRPYNGFTWRERCAVTPVQNAAVRDGRIMRPTLCTICGDGRHGHPPGRDYRYLHLEDYRMPKPWPVISPCAYPMPCSAALIVFSQIGRSTDRSDGNRKRS